MKRLNPETGKPFRRGDIRKDGCVFQSYGVRKRKDGTFYEVWMNPQTFKVYEKASYSRMEKRRATNSGRATQLLNSAKRRHTSTLTKSWLLSKLQSGTCELTGLPFDLSPTNEFTQNPFSPSLDRINANLKEYTPENTRVVLCGVNQALNQHGEQTMLPILKAMVAAIEAKHG